MIFPEYIVRPAVEIPIDEVDGFEDIYPEPITVNEVVSNRGSAEGVRKSWMVRKRAASPQDVPARDLIPGLPGVKVGDEIKYFTRYGPETHKFVGVKEGKPQFQCVQSYRVQTGRPSGNLEPAFMVSKDEAKRIDDQLAYFAQDGASPGQETAEDYAYARSRVLDELSERTGLDRGSVNQFLAHWAESSNDHDPIAMQMQAGAASALGAKLSAWQQDTSRQFNYSSQQEKEGANFIREMHSWTQEDLDDFGITEVTLFRGLSGPEAVKLKLGEKVNLDSNAIESWASEPQTALDFASQESGGGIILKATFPAEQILSTPRTGLGCMSEHEFTVLNSKPITATVTYHNT